MTAVDLTDMELTTPSSPMLIELENTSAELTTIRTVIDGVAMMDAAEAREYIKMMGWDLEAADSALKNFRARALDFAEREGWRALGYGGALEALQTELGAQHSKSYLSRILQAGEIERVLDLPIGQLPERTLRPLAQLDTADQQIAAYQAATANGKPTAAKMQEAVDQIKPPAPDPLPSEDEQHRITIEAILKEAEGKGERTGTRLYQQAYDHAREIHDVGLYNKMIALIDRATDEPDPAHVERLEAQIDADRIPETGMEIAPLSDRQAHIAQEQADQRIIMTAENAIQVGENDRARQLLDQVSAASAWKRDQLLATIAQPRAAGRQITLALDPDDCAALLREARMFSGSELTKRLPAIGQVLLLLVEAIKQP